MNCVGLLMDYNAWSFSTTLVRFIVPGGSKTGLFSLLGDGRVKLQLSIGTLAPASPGLSLSVGLEELKTLGIILGAGLSYRYNTTTRKGERAPGMQPVFQVDQDMAIFVGLSFAPVAAVGAIACVVFAPECAVVAGAAGVALMLGGSAP